MKLASQRSEGQRSFTMIELLVVVAIIAVLAAILLPALQNAKEQSKRVVCMEHLKQVGVATLIMADDNNGWINGSNDPDILPTGSQTWIFAVTNYLGHSDKLTRGGAGVTRGCP